MSKSPSRPVSLHIVTFLIIAIGAVATFRSLAQLAEGRVYLNFNILALAFGIGLAFLRGWARTCTILYAGVIVAIACLGILDALLDLRIIRVTHGGMRTDAHDLAVPVIAVCLIAGGVMVWTIRVLLRNDVSSLFGDYFHRQPSERATHSSEARPDATTADDDARA